MSRFSGVIKNKKAYFDYEILEKIEAGIKLHGYEVKAIKEGKGNLTGTFVKIKDNEVWLVGFDIPPFSKTGHVQNLDTARTRKLLLNKKEIEKLKRDTEEKGYTIAPLKIYIQHGLIKAQIGVAKGKKKSDKKRAIIGRQEERDTRRIIKESNR